MYDELIKSLRDCAEANSLSLYKRGLMKQAADAIEELQKRVPKTPHGRLIDADALMHEFEKAQRTMEQHGQEYSCSFMSDSRELSTAWYCVEDMVENAPTILEAEGGECEKNCYYNTREVKTNADRIRAMTDEEIEKWFWWMRKEMMRYTDSRVFVHDWLRQEATDV